MKKQIIVIVAALCLISLLGVAGYVFIEGWSVFEALYMTSITLTTVGFSEVSELSVAGRMFTIVLLIFGISTYGYALTSVTSLLVEGKIKNAMRNRKMLLRSKKLKNHIVVCGFGRLGSQIVDELEKWNKDFVVIEEDKELIEELFRRKITVIPGSASDDEILVKANIANAYGIICALSTDIQNLFVVLSARRLNKELTIVSKVLESSAEVKFESAGADKLISPYQIGGRRMAQMMIQPQVVNFLDVANHDQTIDLSLREIHITSDSNLKSVKIKNSNIPLKVKVIGLKKPDDKILVNPDANTVLEENDVMIVVGENKYVEILSKNH